MKKQKVLFYVFKWLALIYLSYLLLAEDNSNNQRIKIFLLIGFVATLLIWEGIKDFRTNRKTNK